MSVCRSLRSTVRLNDGVVMPLFGLGVYRANSTKDAVVCAIKQGYRLIDTAEYYNNEEEVGTGIVESGVRRDEVFIVTKIWDHGRQTCYDNFTQSLTKLGTGYVDLYLIHHPMQGQILETYDAMLHLKQQGLVRSVGVSNFNIHHLERLKASGRPLPSVNQIELHMFRQQHPLVDYCQKHNITVMGYSPLSRMQRHDDWLYSLAQKYEKTVAQVLIRWSIQKGYITIPKSSHPDRIISNSLVFDFELTPQEIKESENLPSHSCTKSSFTPQETPWLD